MQRTNGLYSYSTEEATMLSIVKIIVEDYTPFSQNTQPRNLIAWSSNSPCLTIQAFRHYRT